MKGHRLGIFGGTFNPIHLGHLRLAEDVREAFDIARIIFIPAYNPPHKVVSGRVDPLHRLRMVQIAVSDNDYFQCDDFEIRQRGVSYTIATVEHLYRDAQFTDKPYLIVGSDLIGEIETWKDISTLQKRVHFIVLVRDGFPIGENKFFPRVALHRTWDFYERRKIDITSSEIRKRLSERRSIRYLVPEGVLEYIKEKRLYVDE